MAANPMFRAIREHEPFLREIIGVAGRNPFSARELRQRGTVIPNQMIFWKLWRDGCLTRAGRANQVNRWQIAPAVWDCLRPGGDG